MEDSICSINSTGFSKCVRIKLDTVLLLKSVWSSSQKRNIFDKYGGIGGRFVLGALVSMTLIELCSVDLRMLVSCVMHLQ